MPKEDDSKWAAVENIIKKGEASSLPEDKEKLLEAGLDAELDSGADAELDLGVDFQLPEKD